MHVSMYPNWHIIEIRVETLERDRSNFTQRKVRADVFLRTHSKNNMTRV